MWNIPEMIITYGACKPPGVSPYFSSASIAMPLGFQFGFVRSDDSQAWNKRVFPEVFVPRVQDQSCHVWSAACQMAKSTDCCLGSVRPPRSGSEAISIHSPETRGSMMGC